MLWNFFWYNKSLESIYYNMKNSEATHESQEFNIIMPFIYPNYYTMNKEIFSLSCFLIYIIFVICYFIIIKAYN